MKDYADKSAAEVLYDVLKGKKFSETPYGRADLGEGMAV